MVSVCRSENQCLSPDAHSFSADSGEGLGALEFSLYIETFFKIS